MVTDPKLTVWPAIETFNVDTHAAYVLSLKKIIWWLNPTLTRLKVTSAELERVSKFSILPEVNNILYSFVPIVEKLPPL